MERGDAAPNGQPLSSCRSCAMGVPADYAPSVPKQPSPPDWKRVSEELRRLTTSPQCTPAEQAEITALADVVATGDVGAMAHQYFHAVWTLTGSRWLSFREEGRFVQAIDPEKFDKTPLGEYIDVIPWYASRRSNAKVQRAAECWASSLPDRMSCLLRDFETLKSWDVPDFLGALFELVRDLAEAHTARSDGKTPTWPEVPPEVKAVADKIRRGTASVSVAESPLHIGHHWSFGEQGFRDLLIEREAVAYLKDVHGLSVSGTTLGERAKEFPALKSGARFVKEALAQAAKSGRFEHGNLSRRRGI